MEEENKQTNQIKSWLMNTLTGFGIPSNWAKVITGAIMGALIAIYALTQTSCGIAGITSTANGTTITGADGSQAVITPSTFTWQQKQPDVPTGEVIKVEGNGK